jgi:hypothetical protein
MSHVTQGFYRADVERYRMTAERICLIDVVGLTPDLVGEHTPVLRELAAASGSDGARPLEGVGFGR